MSTIDAINYVVQFGILLDNIWVYDPYKDVNVSSKFSLIFSISFLKFVFFKRKFVLKNLKRIKFYKNRSKYIVKKKKFIWVPSNYWIEQHAFIYISRGLNVEFNFKTLTGVLLYKNNIMKHSNMYDIINLSLYMFRSYNWKYAV